MVQEIWSWRLGHAWMWHHVVVHRSSPIDHVNQHSHFPQNSWSTTSRQKMDFEFWNGSSGDLERNPISFVLYCMYRQNGLDIQKRRLTALTECLLNLMESSWYTNTLWESPLCFVPNSKSFSSLCTGELRLRCQRFPLSIGITGFWFHVLLMYYRSDHPTSSICIPPINNNERLRHCTGCGSSVHRFNS